MRVVDAKEKVCPFMSLNGIDRNGISYVIKSKCVGGDCMAWAWDSVRISEYDGHPAFTDKSNTSGYCLKML